MIVPNPRPSQCDRFQIMRLNQDEVTDHQANLLAHHLDHCEHCRSLLDETLISDGDWHQARTVILSRTSSSKNSDATAVEEVCPRESFAWLQPCSTPEERDQYLGILDGYPIVRVVGVGGMGIVFEGWDRELHRPVAIKAMHPHLAAIGVARQRFVREARCAASIVHANVIAIHKINAEHYPPYLVMPLIAGESLQSRMDRDGPMACDQALRITAQVANGLAAADQQGLVHRDVKPANILVEHGTDRALLTDFGLVRALHETTVTMSGSIAGTPQYMSPEQASGMSVDHRSDIYSLGAVLYAMLTGHPPHEAQIPLALVKKIAEDKPKPITYFEPSVPKPLVLFVEWMMEIDIRRRIESAKEVAVCAMELHAHVLNPTKHELPSMLRRLLSRNRWMSTKKTLMALSIIVLFCAVVCVLIQSLITKDRMGLEPDAGSVANKSDGKPNNSPTLVDVEDELSQLSEAMNRMEAEALQDLKSLSGGSMGAPELDGHLPTRQNSHE
jgi:eukaryotic-like serine/threonine-protein kinase